MKPFVYVLWGTSAAAFGAIAGTMLAWTWVCEKIDEAFASF